jgi:two-component system response regulator HydG
MQPPTHVGAWASSLGFPIAWNRTCVRGPQPIGGQTGRPGNSASHPRILFVYAYLSLLNGPRAGTNYLLDAGQPIQVGRGMDCQISLNDPLSSRVHAVISCGTDGWWVRDAESRNGTFVNGQKIDEARLREGCVVRFGSAEFTFRETLKMLAAAIEPTDSSQTQTIVRDQLVGTPGTDDSVLEALRNPDRAEDLLLLFQLSIKLLGCGDPDEVMRIALDLLLSRTRASVAGFLWRSDDDQLKPKLVIPEDADGKVALSETLTKRVCEQGCAVWVASQFSSGNTKSLRHFADAICVPLVDAKTTVGAIHLYRERGGFAQSDFDISISVANILVVALARARRQATLQAQHERLVAKNADFDELIGDSPPMQELKSKILRIGRASGCVLVRGESGAGKELVARAIHRNSQRADRPLLPVNCAAIPRDLMESQLFGHKKGAFTGAESDHTGWFQQADSGTLFLDEVGEMTLEGQAKLLRILEGHPFLPVGGSKEVRVDVRVIAATNRDLREFVRDGRFREDLYYRLSVFELYIPPLRERGQDIERLVDFFLDHFRRQHGRPQLQLTDDARRKLLGHGWPGNVRQLRNVIDSAVVLAEHQLIEAQDLGLRDVGRGDELESLEIAHWERKLIKEALDRTSGNVPQAARLLGIGRATLYRKLDDYGIKRS